MKEIDEITGDVLDVALRLHRELGPGLLESAFRADILIEHRLLVEVKSVERLMPVHSKQLLTYLRLMKQPIGLLVNSGGETLKEGVKRIVNDYQPSSAPPLSSPRLRVNNPSSGA